MKSYVFWMVLAVVLLGILWILEPTEEEVQPETLADVVPQKVEAGISAVERTELKVAPKKRNRFGFVVTPSTEEEQEEDLPVFASGIVLDYEGWPLANARVKLTSKNPTDEPTEGLEGIWSHGRTSAVTNIDGHFVLRAKQNNPDCLLLVKHHECETKSVEVKAGAQGMVISLARPTTVRGRVLIEDAFSDVRLVVHLTAPGAKSPFEGFSQVLQEDGTFTLRKHPSGDWVLHISFLRERLTIHSIPLFLDPSGGILNLEDIDVRGMARRIQIKVLSENGEPMQGAWASTPEGEILAQSISAPLEILSIEPRLDLLVGGRQHQTLSLPNVANEETVVLQEGFLIPTQVQGFPEPMTWKLLGYFQPVDTIPGSSRAPGDLFPFASDGAGMGKVPQRGGYHLHLLAMPITKDVYYQPFEFGDAKARGIFTAAEQQESSARSVVLSNAEITDLLDRMAAHAAKASFAH